MKGYIISLKQGSSAGCLNPGMTFQLMIFHGCWGIEGNFKTCGISDTIEI